MMCGEIETKLRLLSNLPVFKAFDAKDDVLEAPSERARRFALRCCLHGEKVFPPRELDAEMQEVTSLIENIATEAAAIAWQFIADEVRARHGVNK